MLHLKIIFPMIEHYVQSCKHFQMELVICLCQLFQKRNMESEINYAESVFLRLKPVCKTSCLSVETTSLREDVFLQLK